MNSLMTKESVMSSYDFLNGVINPSREKAGEQPVANRHFIGRVEDELDDLSAGKTFTRYGNTVKYYDLNMEQMTLVGMRESKAVRRIVLNKLKELSNQSESQVPQTFAEALRLAATLEEEKERIALERDQAIKTKAEIGNRREATAMATASTAVRKANQLQKKLDQSQEYATVKRMEMIHHGIKFNWRILKKASEELNLPPIDVFDQNYGTVKGWHCKSWEKAYAIKIEEVN